MLYILVNSPLLVCDKLQAKLLNKKNNNQQLSTSNASSSDFNTNPCIEQLLYGQGNK